jgi:uncharacterized protein DUF4157
MGTQRKLTEGEITLARAAFGDKIKYGRVRLSDGPGNNAFAHMAFAKGNPAITIGSTVYFKRDFCPDFSAPGKNRKSYMHEMTHVWQYQTLGMPAFFARYGAEFVQVGGKPGDMYKYTKGVTKFDEAMLEAQANMIGDYSEALWAGNEAGKATIARNVAGSGLYGL